jgi:hypothetical protein
VYGLEYGVRGVYRVEQGLGFSNVGFFCFEVLGSTSIAAVESQCL